MALATNHAATQLRAVLTVDEALRTLQAMLREERAFDSDVVERIEELFRALPDEFASVELVQGLLDIQYLLNERKLFRKAAPAGLKAVRWARQLSDQRLLAKALAARALTLADNHDLCGGFEGLMEALQISKEIRDVRRMAVCYQNLAVLMGRVGREQAALACIEACFELCDELSAEHQGIRIAAIVSLSERHLKQRNWHAALDSARRAQMLLGAGSFYVGSQGCAIQNEVLAHLYLYDFDSAEAGIERLTALARERPTELEEFRRFVVAMYDGFCGNTFEAAKSLREFESLPGKREEALRGLVDIHERAGEPHKALEATRKLLELVRSVRREVTETDLGRINIQALDADDDEIRELISRSAKFEVAVNEVGNKFHAKLAYLFELGVSAELREEDGAYAGEHIYRVGRLCAALGMEAGHGEELCWLAEIAGRTHDVGKTSLPSHTVLKAEALNAGEKDILRTHAEDGAALVAQLAEPRLVQVVAAVRHHHERWDGAGYPSRLRGEEIPLLARIVAICDSFDAMTHSRSFRSTRSVTSALQEIERCAGGQFEPRLAGLFVNLVRRLQREHGDLDEYLGEPGRRTRWAKSHPELMRLLEERRTTL